MRQHRLWLLVRSLARYAAPLAMAGAVTGCVVAPPPAPLVALPGQGKTYLAFQQDDLACRIAVGQVPVAATDGTPQAAVGVAATAQTVPVADPALGYLQCMTARGNVIQPLPQAYATVYPGYGYVYSGFGDYYPWLYADRVAFGFWGFGWGGGWGYYGHGYGGFRGYYGGFGRGGFYGGGYDRGGFNRGGFDRGGFNRDGFNRGGFGGAWRVWWPRATMRDRLVAPAALPE